MSTVEEAIVPLELIRTTTNPGGPFGGPGGDPRINPSLADELNMMGAGGLSEPPDTDPVDDEGVAAWVTQADAS